MTDAPRKERSCQRCSTTFVGVAQQKQCDDCRRAFKRAWARERYRTNESVREANRVRARERHRALRDQIVPKLREHARKRHLARKLAALRRYGEACVCCGERDYRFLTLDHSDGDGAEHRRQLLGSSRAGGAPFLVALERLDWPDVTGLRTLCANCHMAHDLWGSCPHHERRVSDRLSIGIDLARALIEDRAGDDELESAR
jgi:hypothetical protein